MRLAGEGLKVIALEFPFSFQRIEASEAGDKLFLVDERTLHMIAVGENAAVAERTVSLRDQGVIVAVSTTDPYAVAWQEDGKRSWLAGINYAHEIEVCFLSDGHKSDIWSVTPMRLSWSFATRRREFSRAMRTHSPCI